MANCDIGLIGLAVMGENLALNMESRGFSVAVYNRTEERTASFVGGKAKGRRIEGASTLADFVSKLSKPRKVFLMVKAGSAVDGFIEQLAPLLDKGDCIIDGGNSLFTDTERRCKEMAERGLLYVGTGVSGGEEGALHGPAMMPGGHKEAWNLVKPIFQAISAKTPDGAPCCEWVGEGGAGHFVKMVHNGIEYGDMELICEAYCLMRDLLKMSADEMATVFAEWNGGALDSYLIQITADILRKKDADGSPLVDKILDAAGQKGTGKWTVISALDSGVPLTLISDAVFSRCLSAIKDERVKAEKLLSPSSSVVTVNKKDFIPKLRDALFASKIVSYDQGFALMREASELYKWDLNFGGIALIWRAGCIIRSRFLDSIKAAFDKDARLQNLMTAPYFREELARCTAGLREVCAASSLSGVSAGAMHSALSYYDGYRTARGGANLLQAQRDYFGAHTYERIDKERGAFFHTNWV